ncbi:MAG: hypothetical protein WC318_07135 [Candidatus Omnitrophota bacterium]|jgi:hypothetical protein
MKRLFIALFIIFLLASPAFASGFCEGWHAGYIAGHCYQQPFCIQIIVPLCPLPHVGEDNYQGGYNRGFLAGLNSR